MKLFLISLLLLTVQISFSQSTKPGTWNILNFKYNLDKKWSLFAESQTRSQLIANNFFYYEIKGGIGYSLNKNFSLLTGAGRYATYSPNANFKQLTNEEFRLWEQLTMNQYLNRLKIEHRYRIEQRWLSNGGYRNRFRYRLTTTLPLNNKKLDPKTFYLTAFEEIFLTDIAPFFERNRAFGGVGYKFSNAFVLQSGYIYQFDYRPDNTKSGKGFLQIALFIELERYKTFHEKLPAAID